MHLKQIQLNQFRNISDLKIDFSKQINIIYGKNGQGKTSLLEAIYLLAITKSFRTKADKVIIQHLKEYLQLTGQFDTDRHDSFSIRVYFSFEEGKHVFLNNNKVEKFSALIGKVPVTLLSLEDMELTYGLPQNRRKFIDILLSQISPVYLSALQSYKKILAHRNSLLSLIAEKKENAQALFPWNEQLLKHGSDIIWHRQQFVQYANQKISIYYQRIALNDEKINIRYKTNLELASGQTTVKEIEKIFRKKLAESQEADILRQNTLTGPHRDDLVFYKDGYILKSFGSQGENKTLLIAIKLIESDYLKEKTSENPILLMDDIFGELDDTRIANLLGSVKEFGQTFITTNSSAKFGQLPMDNAQFIQMENGMAT